MAIPERLKNAIRMIPLFLVALSAMVPLTALLITQFPMIFNTPFRGFGSTPIVPELSVTQWQRIRIRTSQDLDMSLTAIYDILKYPEAALSINEMTFDPQRVGSHVGSRKMHASDVFIPEDLNEDEKRMMDAVDTIGLDSMLEEHVKKALIWKSRKSDTQGTEKGGLYSKQALKRQYWEAQYADAIAILFCSLSPNLAVLRTSRIPPVFGRYLTTINYRWASEGDGKSILANLNQVHLVESRWSGILNDGRFYRWIDILQFIRHFHRLPSLKTFSASVVSDEKDEIFETPPGLSALKSISITHSSISSEIIGSLIRLPVSLESVTFTTGGRDTNDGSGTIVLANTIGQCLDQHKSTLRSIDLDLDSQLHYLRANSQSSKFEEEEYQEMLEFFREDPHWAKDEKDSEAKGYTQRIRDLPETKTYGATVGGFADFENLENLKIGMHMLLGKLGEKDEAPANLVDMFPPSLKHLTIRGYQKGELATFDRQIESFLKEKGNKLPLLESIEGIDERIPNGEPGFDCEELGDCESGEVPPLYEEPRVNDGWLEVEKES